MVSRVEQDIINCIENKESFILDAGAGSGKTWTLVQILTYLISKKGKSFENNHQQIVCITYTNVAKNEIIERTEHNSLIKVATIHDFLWDCIKKYQKELKIKLLEYVTEKLTRTNDELATKKRTDTAIYRELSEKSQKLQNAVDSLENNDIKISYENYPKYAEGKFEHDDLIVIAKKIFASYPMINKIISDTFPIIFVDEYQDTSNDVIEILLDYLKPHSNVVIGFFGDKVQQIYEGGVGEIPEIYGLNTIPKAENYRCSHEVIELLNKLREDLQQFQPPENTKTGEVLFFHLNNPNSFHSKEFIENNLISRWHLGNTGDVKILYLTHRYIAKENNYEGLFALHDNAEVLTKNKDNRGFKPFTDFLFDIEEISTLYLEKKIQLLLKKILINLNSFEAKNNLKKIMDELIEIRATGKIKDVIKHVLDKKLLPKSDRMKNYDFDDVDKKSFYDQLMNIDYAQFNRLYQVYEKETPFSTKHGTKGDEFNNVMVVIDDNAWRNYNFNNFFSKTDTSEKRMKMTNNLFYVVCSRAKKNLAVVFCSELSEASKEVINQWFGNIHIV